MNSSFVSTLWQEGESKIEYRAWNPFRSKLAAAILGGVDQIHIKPGAKVMYLGAASGTTVSHVSDIVGPVSFYWLKLKWSHDHVYDQKRNVEACVDSVQEKENHVEHLNCKKIKTK